MLGSVARTCDKGNRVVFEAGGGYIENLKSGACTNFGRESNIYVLKTWVQRPAGHKSSSFHRQGTGR